MAKKLSRLPPFSRLMPVDFTFQTTGYQVWKKGDLKKQAEIDVLISAKVIRQRGKDKTEVTFADERLKSLLTVSAVFDQIFTGIDNKFHMVTIPASLKPIPGPMISFAMGLGTTRTSKVFSKGEPFCCTFIIDKKAIGQIEFICHNPEQMVRFY